jgi:hypothetical protein
MLEREKKEKKRLMKERGKEQECVYKQHEKKLRG